MANRTQIQNALHKPYDRILFSKEVLSPVFGSGFSLSSTGVLASVQPNKSEQAVIDTVSIYGNITLEDGTEITCYEIQLQKNVRIEQSKVAIQRYVRKLLTAGQAALVNFVSPANKNVWRLTLVAKDSELTEEGIKEKTTHAKRYTYLLGPSETCKTAAERFETLSTERQINFQALVNAFSVEKLSKAFFDEYTLHYEKFIEHLNKSNFKKSVFKADEKAIRDFTKKLLGRIVFLYFVQKKGWLGASNLDYKDGLTDFMKTFFKSSGGDETFYSNWLTVLFFETLNKERSNDDFKMPDNSKVKVPFLNGGLFDKEEHDEHILTFKSKLFHNPDFEDSILTEKNRTNSRGFLDFLNAFNFTVHEDSPDDHTVAVDPEMLGHIFENLLEDNKDKGAFYTPKEIVHYMCQESLTEYLTTHLSKEFTVYRQIDKEQIELFGNDGKLGQLKMMVQLGDKALNRDDVAYIVKHKDISQLTNEQLKRIDVLLSTVKICDPAIGSGAFPMGLLQEIHAIKEVIAYELKHEWKPAEVKENIIQNSIYGVDIEKGAVDIARLRFWLSLVVDEEKPRALPNLDYKIVVGDSLVSKFENEIIEIDWERKQSVGKADTYIQNVQRLLKEIADKQKKFFKPDNKDKKKQQAEIRNLKLELLINQLSFNKEIFLGKNVVKGGFMPTAADQKYNAEIKLTKKNFENLIDKLQDLKKKKDEPFEHFDWKLDFPEVLNPNLVTDENQRGFDIVIANPPYLGEKGHKEIFRRIKLTSLNKFYLRKMDLFYFFFHQAINLGKNHSNIVFITTNYFPTSNGGRKLRQDFHDRCSVLKLINLNELKIFESALGQHNMITVLSKGKKELNAQTCITHRAGFFNSLVLQSVLNFRDSNTNYYSIPQDELYDGGEFYIRIIGSASSSNDPLQVILEKLKSQGTELGQLCNVNQGILTGADKVSDKHIREFPKSGFSKGSGVFVLNQQETSSFESKELLKPWFKNSDIEKYTSKQASSEKLLYVTRDLDIDDYKDAKKHLLKFEKIIKNRPKERGEMQAALKVGKWWVVFAARKDIPFSGPKIIAPQRSKQNIFGYNEVTWYASADVYYITQLDKSISLKYILAILNSKLFFVWLYHRGKRKGESLELYQTPLTEIPIKVPDDKTQKLFAEVCDEIISRKKSGKDTSSLEKQIDKMVYKLYDLTESQIEIVENGK